MAYQYYGYRPYNEYIRRKVTIALGQPFYNARKERKPGVVPPSTNADVDTLTLLLRPRILPPAVSYPKYSNVIIDLMRLADISALMAGEIPEPEPEG